MTGVQTCALPILERANDIIWRPQPYIAQSFDGTDMTSNFKDFVLPMEMRVIWWSLAIDRRSAVFYLSCRDVH